MADALWWSIADFGQYPARLYRGTAGVLLNIVIPVTLMASIPVDFLFGRLPIHLLFLYVAIVAILFLLTRLFWSAAVEGYSGSGS